MSGFKTRALELISAAKSGDPVINLKRSVNAETLWPASLELESHKAAVILRSFFVDGFIVPYKTTVSCQQEILKKCHGLVVLHLLREGLRSPDASGSGVIVARLLNGDWSDAAGILVDFDGNLGSGVDVVDVTLVINDCHAVSSFLEGDCILGKTIRIAPGPLPKSDAGSVSSYSSKPSDAPVWYYAKSKGQLLEVDLAGLRIRDAGVSTEQYYGAQEILSGKVKNAAGFMKTLHDTVITLESLSGDFGKLPASSSCPGDRRVRASTMNSG